ncbi:hypothetical protein [Actinomadura rubrisoli]|uniref:Uncharacterized protein n=1 Tax=Actinomadura rubrisoli TaxID=2530368 RepID=A0A4R5AX77_9ACTN|nr:hypothetical protein [Actinomadura rubrisoli]TDD77721.1 hypothetical protein E1298_29780 [Actinomadura rubrisoli]
MALCARCYAPAVVKYEGRGRSGYRAVLACQWDRNAAYAWTATAGPVTTTPITTDATATALATLF